MRVVNENLETITEYDLDHGRLLPATAIREDAAPIDNVKKFAWADEDYESVMMYIPDPVYTPEEMAAQARARRDRLLDACDWTQVLDAPIDAATREAYRIYRQALRDIPEQPGFPETIDWPAVPEITKAAPDPVDAAFDELVGGADNA